MQVQKLNNISGICFADFSVEMCKVVASYYLMKAVPLVDSNDSNLIDLRRAAECTFKYWVSRMLTFHAIDNHT